jgi:hypothetical protein
MFESFRARIVNVFRKEKIMNIPVDAIVFAMLFVCWYLTFLELSKPDKKDDDDDDDWNGGHPVGHVYPMPVCQEVA